MVTDDLKHIRWYNAKSRYLKSMRPKLGNSMEGINAIIKLRETPKYWHIMYDKYRNVYYRFAEMPYKLASNESPYDEPKGKEFSVIVLNADFEIIGETKFPGKKYFYKRVLWEGKDCIYPRTIWKIRNSTRTSWCLPALKLKMHLQINN